MPTKHEMIILVIVIIGSYFLLFGKKTAAALSALPSLGDFLPAPISYNNNPDYYHSRSTLPLVMPNQAAGQNNSDSAGSCDICSLFPHFNMVQL